MKIYLVVRQFREDYDVEIKPALSHDAALRIANELVDDTYARGYEIYLDDNKYFTRMGYKEYLDGDEDYSVCIWIEESEAY